MIKLWLIFLAALFSGNVLACKCEASMIKLVGEKAEYIYSSSKNVFLAKITRSTPVGKVKNDSTTLHYFEIIDSYKGNPENFTFLQSGSENPTSCNDDGMIEGSFYLVFTDTNNIFDCSVLEVEPDTDYFKKLFMFLSELRNKNVNAVRTE